MRVCVVTTSYPRAGDDIAGHFVRTEARMWARAGHAVSVIAPGGPPIAEDDGVTHFAISGGGAFGHPGVAERVRARPWRAVDALAFCQQATALVRNHGPWHRVVGHWAVPSAWPIAWYAHTRAWATKACGPHIEVVSHGGDVRLLLALPAACRAAIVERIVRVASEWRFASATLQAALLADIPSRLRTRLEHLSTVAAPMIEMPGVARRAQQLREQLHALHVRAHPPGVHVIVTAGRLTREKRIDRVVDDMAARPPDAVLVVVGDGPERRRLEERARARGATVCFVGQVERPEALAWIAAADEFVFASAAEGCPTVLREAAFLGIPITRLAGAWDGPIGNDRILEISER